MKTCFHNAKCSFSIAKVEKIKVSCKFIMVHTVKNIMLPLFALFYDSCKYKAFLLK